LKPTPFTVVVVARDNGLARRIEGLFPPAEVEVTRESSIDHVVERFESESHDLLLLTSAAFKAGQIDGIELLEVVAGASPATQVLFLVEPRDIRAAMSTVKAGLYEYVKLPVTEEELRVHIEAAMAKKPLVAAPPRRRRGRRGGMGRMIGRSPQMQEVYRQIRTAAATGIPILLSGETGTGKDLAAQAIHQQSERKDGPFVPVHLGAIPPELVGSELFGHEKGAFTGAQEKRAGKFELASEGTIFLDEISTMDDRVQVALLRLLESKKVTRLGGRKSVAADPRVIAATNVNLSEAVRRGGFREDLYYRLDVFHIVLPPLRARQGDIPVLIDEFLKRYNEAYEKQIQGIAPEAVGLLEAYDWPGNVRELKNVIQRAVLVCPGEVLLSAHLPPRFRPDRPMRSSVTFEVGTPLAEVEREMIIQALAVARNNRKRAADLLGISRRALYNKLARHGIG
jgi:DNA-binding NtrC family response regulator